MKEQRDESRAERAAMDAKLEQQRAEMEAKLDAKIQEMREDVTVSPEQLATLQSRVEALHAANLLQEQELYVVEDEIADYLALGSSAKLVQLVRVSEGLPADASFARQVRRRFV
jgi:hypothetical protein